MLGAPLKAEYTEENLALVEAGFCNLRKQVPYRTLPLSVSDPNPDPNPDPNL